MTLRNPPLLTMSARAAWVLPLFLLALGCDALGEAPSMSRTRGTLTLGQWVPRHPERQAIGTIGARIERATPGFRQLTRWSGANVLFKDEEATGADRMMTGRLNARLSRLSVLVMKEWSGVRLRVTEAWDEDGEHGSLSAHYEGRAADFTTSDLDSGKLGRLAYLAVRAGFDWVYFESKTHVHASVRR